MTEETTDPAPVLAIYSRAQHVADVLADPGLRFVPWPAGHRVHVVQLVDDDQVAELVGGRRTHWPMEESAAPQLGDLVAFERALPHLDGAPISATEPGLFQITHLWRHDGIAPEWVIVSLRRVKLAPA